MQDGRHVAPGRTVQEKSITAGISRVRVKNEIERFSISRIGWVSSSCIVVIP